MLKFQSSKISTLQLVRRYPFDSKNRDIRYKQFEFEDAFKDCFPSSPMVTPSIESAPPEVARFVFKHRKMTLFVAGTATQLNLELEESLDFEKINRLLTKYASKMDDALDHILGAQIPSYSGIVGFIIRPYGGEVAEISSACVDELFVKKVENIQALNVDFGYIEDDVLRSINVSGYHSFEGRVKVGEIIHIDGDFSEPSESGLQIKIDVNTKPTMRNYDKNSFSNLVPHFIKMLRGDVKNFIGDLMPDI